jgi:NDP-sugar pyrophosphorylase family protein
LYNGLGGLVHDLSGVTAVILAGGLGTRLRPVFSQRPKALAEVLGRPFLEYLLDQIARWNIRNVVLCTGYLGEQIESYFHNQYKNLHLVYSKEPSPLGTGGALRRAWLFLQSDSVLVLNGDSYCKTDLGSFWGWHCGKGAEATLLLIETSDTSPYGRVETDEEGQILRFDEKCHKEGRGWISAGIYAFGSRFLQSIPDGHPISLERDVFPAWIGGGLYGYKSKGRFLDIGTPESYRLAEMFFAEDALE